MSRRLPIILLMLTATAAQTRLPSDAPPLPAPDPGTFTVINVNTAQELADACWALESNQAIIIAPGIYLLDDRLAVGRFGQPLISNIQIRGASGDPADVELRGAGMLDSAVPFGFQLASATDVLIADLTITDVYYHAVMINGSEGASRIRLYHIRAGNAGQQIIKGSGDDADDVSIEYSEIFYTDGAITHPEGSSGGRCYTNGIDATGGDNWIVRDNLITRIRCQNGALAGPAVLLWLGSSGSLVERNTILDSSRGIYLGLLGDDHSGGMVRNNFIRWNPDATYAVDVPIYSVSPGSQILHNTALTRGQYFNAIEIRFPGATNVVVRNNLLDAAVRLRDGASGQTLDNVTSAEPGWFVNEPSGNLHLTTDAAPALDQVNRLNEASTDFDDNPRPTLPGATDIGAAEFDPDAPIFKDGFEGL